MATHPTRPTTHRRRLLLVIGGSLVTVLLLGAGTILTVGGVFVPARYLEPWNVTYFTQYDDPRMQLVAHGVLAPSGHNMQPWNVRLDPADDDVLSLYADPSRLSTAVDPFSRQVMVSQGAFLAYLRVAAAELGYALDVELFPDGEYDETDLVGSMRDLPVARVTLSPDSSVNAGDYGSLFRSDTNRSPYADTPLTAAQTDSLLSLGGSSTSTVSILSGRSDLASLAELAREGTMIETEYAAATAESNAVFHGTEQSKNEARSGFGVEGQGTSGVMTYVTQGLITLVPAMNDDAAGAQRAIALTDEAVAHTPAYAIIATPGNSRAEQVEAGILYADLSLRARTLGLVMQPLSQVLQEYPTMAAPYAAVHARYAPDGGTIQMLLRIGTPTTEYPVTMRRDPSSLILPD